MQPTKRTAIHLPEDQTILTKQYWIAIANELNALNLSRLKTVSFLDDVIFHQLDVPVFYHNGRPFELHPDIIDEAFVDEDSFRWISDCKLRVNNPPKRNPNKANLLRFQILTIVFEYIGRPIEEGN